VWQAAGGAASVLSVAIALAAWLWPRGADDPGGIPTFERTIATIQDVREFDEFIIEHSQQRARVSVTFPVRELIGDVDDDGPERSFVLGNHGCDPGLEECGDRFSYRLLGMREDDIENVFGWGGAETGNFLRGSYFIGGFGMQMGIQWRAMQVVRSPAP
jgi:hypothetical protein